MEYFTFCLYIIEAIFLLDKKENDSIQQYHLNQNMGRRGPTT